MVRFCISVFFFLLGITAFGQTEIDILVELGIIHHDRGEYDKAIEFYESALAIDQFVICRKCRKG